MQRLTSRPEYYTNRKELFKQHQQKEIFVQTPLINSNSKKYCYFACDLNKRTYFEDYLINYLLKHGYNLTGNLKQADYLLAYKDETYQNCSIRPFKKAVSFSTMLYPALSIGIDENPLQTKPLKKQLNTSLLNDIDKITSDILIVHGQNETKHPWLQAAFFYSSLKDRKPELNTKMLIVPNVDETLYNHPKTAILNDISEQILNFFNHD